MGIVRRAVETAADVAGIDPQLILSQDRRRTVFFAKVMVSRYLKETTWMSARKLAKALKCSHPSMLSRLDFYERTRKYKWKYGEFERMNREFLRRMRE